MKKVTLVVPVYNVYNYLNRCLDSIKNQTYKNIEVIVVNDGSTDNSEKIIQEFVKEDNRFKYIYKQNGGVASARNTGIENASGDYICFIDSDDYIGETFVEVLLKTIKEEDAFSSIDIMRIDPLKPEKSRIIGLNLPNIFPMPSACNKMIRLDLLRNNKIRFSTDIKIGEDLAFTTKLLIKRNSFSIDKTPLYFYVQREGSAVHTFDESAYDIFKAINEIETYATANNKKEEFKSYIEFLNIQHILIWGIERFYYSNFFNEKLFKDCIDYVNNKYKTWYLNEYIDDMLDEDEKPIVSICKNYDYNSYVGYFKMLKEREKNKKEAASKSK